MFDEDGRPPLPGGAAQRRREEAVAEIADRSFETQITYAVVMVVVAAVGLIALVIAGVVLS